MNNPGVHHFAIQAVLLLPPIAIAALVTIADIQLADGIGRSHSQYAIAKEAVSAARNSRQAGYNNAAAPAVASYYFHGDAESSSAQMIQDFRDLLARHGARLGSLVPKSPIAAGSGFELGAEFTFSMQAEEISLLLTDMNNQAPLLLVRQVSITPSLSAPGDHLLSIHVYIIAYWYSVDARH